MSFKDLVNEMVVSDYENLKTKFKINDKKK